MPNSKGNHVKIHGDGENLPFSTEIASPFISETVWDRPMVAIERWQEVLGGGAIRVGSDDLECP